MIAINAAALKRRRAGRAVSRMRRRVEEYPVPAPYGGWNTRDALDAMKETDATVLTNFFPDVNQVKVRRGFREHATGIGSADVDWLAEYFAGSNRELLAAGSGGIYSASGAGAGSLLKGGFASNRWQHVNFNAALIMANGTDKPQCYDGTDFFDLEISGTGLTPTSIEGLAVHKSRLYYFERNSQDFFYGGTNAVGGTVVKFPLSRVAQFGGNLIAIQSWTIDGGDGGVDDLAVFFMSSGDVIIYAGSNPADSSNWTLQGRFRIAEPLATRGFVKVGGDIMLITNQDYVSLTRVLRNRRAQLELSKLSGAAIDAARAYRNNYGWQALLYPKGNRIIFNVPVATGNTYHQHVINTVTGAATKFTGMNARVWATFRGDLYFGGGSGKIYQADVTNADDSSAIAAEARSAWLDLGTKSLKTLKSLRPIFSVPGTQAFTIGLAFDFQPLSISQSLSVSTTGSSPWDTSPWDTTPWGPEEFTKVAWYGGAGQGRKILMQFQASVTNQAIEWERTDFTFTKDSGL